jgi:hypothetical protein
MSFRLIVKEEADREIIKSFLWYEEQWDGLGEEFLQHIEKSLDAITSHPLQHQKI